MDERLPDRALTDRKGAAELLVVERRRSSQQILVHPGAVLVQTLNERDGSHGAVVRVDSGIRELYPGIAVARTGSRRRDAACRRMAASREEKSRPLKPSAARTAAECRTSSPRRSC